jgi:hypothetical protein
MAMPTIFFALGVVMLVGLAVFGAYAAGRHFFNRKASEDTKDLSGSVIFRNGSLHGLLLALVFAQAQVNVVELRRTTSVEAAAIADLFYDLDRYEPGGNIPLRIAAARYVREVMEVEWETLARGKFDSSAWALWDEVFNGVLDMVPDSPRRTALRERMLHDIDTISECRNIRLADSSSGITGLFWLIALIGIIFVALPYFCYQPRRVNLVLIGTFAAYYGLVVCAIYTMSNPYSPPRTVTPLPFQQIYEDGMQQFLAEHQ